MGQCGTKEQLEFNHRLLLDVKKCAADMGWVWGEGYETDFGNVFGVIIRCVCCYCFALMLFALMESILYLAL
jgi:hypothetical protein